jgi:hypothetical protein
VYTTQTDGDGGDQFYDKVPKLFLYSRRPGTALKHASGWMCWLGDHHDCVDDGL